MDDEMGWKNSACTGLFRIINISTGVASGVCAVSLALTIIEGPAFTEPGGATQLLRLYAMLLAAVVALVETEAREVMTRVRVLESYLPRALVQVWLALSTRVLAAGVHSGSDLDASIRWYRAVGVPAMLVCAAVYAASGVLGYALFRDGGLRRLQRGRLTRLQAELEDLERQRDQIMGLLICSSAKV